MKHRLLLTIISAVALLASSNSADYTNQAEWGGSCKGTRQSPIHISSADSASCGPTKMNVSLFDGNTTVLPISGTQNLQSQFPSSVLTIVDVNSNLLQYVSAQYHLHTPSEHHIDGASSAVELHIVHKLFSLFSDTNSYAVIGLLFDINDTATNTLFSQIDFTTTARVNFKTIMTDYLTKYPTFHYQGSFTTPNCDEIVNWYVVQQKFSITTAELNTLKTNATHILNPNNRDIQNLNGRTVRLISQGCNIDMPTVKYSLLAKSSWRLACVLAMGLLSLLAY